MKLKRFMRITTSTDDTLLEELIDSTSALIQTVTGRVFNDFDYRERKNGEIQRRMLLKHWPVNTVNRISYGAGNAFHLSFTGSAIRANASFYKVDSSDTTGGLRLVTVNSSGTRTATDLPFATYASVTSLVAQINATTGWTATEDNNVPTLDLNQVALGDCLNSTVYATYPDIDDYDFTVDSQRGIIEFNRLREFIPDRWGNERYESQLRYRPSRLQNLLIEYNAGYATIPADVELCCHTIANQLFYEGEDNPSIKSETTGPYSVTFTDGVLAGQIRDMLLPYIDGRAMVGGD
ncbi:MAG TPA: phage head-tail connector protein [Prosthecobacter sp.]|nr:phage head-tail connector protein [Prosthecobacter sp.]